MKLGGTLYKGISKLLDGPLGVVQVGFDGYDLGKTTADTMCTPNQAIKDILYQQSGTMKADTVRTGIMFQLKATFGEINTGLLAAMMAGVSAPITDPSSDGAVFDRNIYQSMRQQEAKSLKIASVDANGVPSDIDENVGYFYEAVPMVDADLINWGADSQRELPITFDIYWHAFDDGESATYDGAFWYYGDPTALDVPAAPWPDRFGPQLVSAEATSATEVKLTFDEDMVLVGGKTLTECIVVKVNEEFVVPATAAIGADPNDDEIDLTLPAASIASGDAVLVYIGAGCVEDTEATPNKNGAIDSATVVNSVP